MEKTTKKLNQVQKKLQEKIEKRDKYKAKLVFLYKHFRGVKHENSLSELQDSQIKVYEDFVRSLNEEIEKIKSDLKLN